MMWEEIKYFRRKWKAYSEFHFEGGYFLDLNVDDKKTKYDVSTLNLDEDNMSSTLVLYEMNGKEINRYKFNDEILIFTQFVNNDSLILLTDSKIYF